MGYKRKTSVRRKRRAKRQKFDVQKWLNKLGVELHWPGGYQYMGPGTYLKERLARNEPGINRLDRIAKKHDIDYDKAKGLADKIKADRLMVARIDALPGRKSVTERIVKRIIQAKIWLNI